MLGHRPEGTQQLLELSITKLRISQWLIDCIILKNIIDFFLCQNGKLIKQFTKNHFSRFDRIEQEFVRSKNSIHLAGNTMSTESIYKRTKIEQQQTKQRITKRNEVAQNIWKLECKSFVEKRKKTKNITALFRMALTHTKTNILKTSITGQHI